MRRIFTFGETILDIIFKNGAPVAARPGGAMLNTAVSLGRCGLPVNLISEISDDIVGAWILDFLNKNRVKTDHLHIYQDGATPIAIATLDDAGEASYSFYKPYPKERLSRKFPELTSEDILLFGSFYSVTPEIRPKVAKFICSAKDRGALIIYDPNIRANHAGKIKELRHLIDENLKMADIVRASNVDLENIFNTSNLEECIDKIVDYDNILILTRGENEVSLVSGKNRIHKTPDKITLVSTIGAGDSFNAGMIYGICQNHIDNSNKSQMSESIYHSLLHAGLDFAGSCCQSFDNYISEDFATQLR
jgi:fructokinase